MAVDFYNARLTSLFFLLSLLLSAPCFCLLLLLPPAAATGERRRNNRERLDRYNKGRARLGWGGNLRLLRDPTIQHLEWIFRKLEVIIVLNPITKLFELCSMQACCRSKN